jgi:hypothetical protein
MFPSILIEETIMYALYFQPEFSIFHAVLCIIQQNILSAPLPQNSIATELISITFLLANRPNLLHRPARFVLFTKEHQN